MGRVGTWWANSQVFFRTDRNHLFSDSGNKKKISSQLSKNQPTPWYITLKLKNKKPEGKEKQLYQQVLSH